MNVEIVFGFVINVNFKVRDVFFGFTNYDEVVGGKDFKLLTLFFVIVLRFTAQRSEVVSTASERMNE